jgi:hypothetical protein
MATRTFTIDTASSPWVYSDGTQTTITGTAGNFTLTFDDKGAGGNYYGGGGNVDLALANGDLLKISMDPGKTYFVIAADATAAPNAGLFGFLLMMKQKKRLRLSQPRWQMLMELGQIT